MADFNKVEFSKGAILVIIAFVCWTVFLNALISQLLALVFLLAGVCFLGKSFSKPVDFPNPDKKYTIDCLRDLYNYGWILIPCLMLLIWMFIKLQALTLFPRKIPHFVFSVFFTAGLLALTPFVWNFYHRTLAGIIKKLSQTTNQKEQ